MTNRQPKVPPTPGALHGSNAPSEASLDDLPSDEAVLAQAYGSPGDPIGIHLKPAIGGWISANTIDEQAFLSRTPIFEKFDPTGIEPPVGKVIPEVGHLATDAASQPEESEDLGALSSTSGEGSPAD